MNLWRTLVISLLLANFSATNLTEVHASQSVLPFVDSPNRQFVVNTDGVSVGWIGSKI